MVNPFLGKRADKSVAKALREVKRDAKDKGRISVASVLKIMEAAHDGGTIDDVEFRDLKRILRTESLEGFSRRLLEAYVHLNYSLTGPFVYDGDIDKFENHDLVGSHQCAALVQATMPIGQVVTWREGIPVRGNGHLIKKGTAVATFEDGFYPNRDKHNHVAYYISQDSDGIVVMDQWKGKEEGVTSRLMKFKGKWANGLFVDPSNNGDALSVIMKRG